MRHFPAVEYRISVISGAEAAEQRPAILAGLREFNLSHAPPTSWDPLAISVLDKEGIVAGGLYGVTSYDWLIVELLFVPKGLRGTGLGSRLIGQAEEEARARGCIGAWLDTFSFQARGFYEKLGYSVIASIADHPVGGARHFLVKRWDGCR